MKKYFLVAALLIIITPSIVLASWWNPLSWHWGNLFHKKETVQTEEVQKLQEQIDELKKQQITTVAPITPPVIKKVVPETPTTNTPTTNQNNIALQQYLDSINKQEADRVAAEQAMKNSPECISAKEAYDNIQQQIKNKQNLKNNTTPASAESRSLNEQLADLAVQEPSIRDKYYEFCENFISTPPTTYSTDCYTLGGTIHCTTQ